jgi:hypothetical protein
MSAGDDARTRVLAEAIQWYLCASGMNLNTFERPLFAAVQAYLAATDSTTRIPAQSPAGSEAER